jgi:hypothetical protein
VSTIDFLTWAWAGVNSARPVRQVGQACPEFTKNIFSPDALATVELLKSGPDL